MDLDFSALDGVRAALLALPVQEQVGELERLTRWTAGLAIEVMSAAAAGGVDRSLGSLDRHRAGVLARESR